MILVRTALAIPVAIALLAGGTVDAAAQWPGAPPAAERSGPSPFDAPPESLRDVVGFPPPPPPCLKDFVPLRQDAEDKAGLVRIASHRKAPREELCGLITNFAAAEDKMMLFVEVNSASCGIPKQIASQMKATHERTLRVRTQVCSAAPVAKPAAPSLSDALGTATAPVPETAKTRNGTFNTLCVNADQWCW